MKYTITETVDTVNWNEFMGHAPAEMVKEAKEMFERGEPAIFGKSAHHSNPNTCYWLLLSINPAGQLYVLLRSTWFTLTPPAS